MSMRLSLEGIGAVLGRDDEYTAVRQIVKGGPADRQGKLKVGDRIVGVGQGASGQLTDVIGWRLDDVVDMIRGEKGTTVRIEVIPADAGNDVKPSELAIVREKVKLEEQAAKRRVLEIDADGGKHKIGIIELPTFYHDFEGQRRGDADYRSSTRDVARLLKELKSERVEGVVVDLRDNGGGSLSEATQLTGLFIDSGPVVQVRDAQGSVNVEEDRDPSVTWDGPLAVLVNRGSASASEIFAAALQDYGRAIIVGENTFGKGTVQNLVDLDQMARNDKPRYGQLKMTIAQFFRINGGSTQHKGVIPDVAFPATWDPKDFGESALDNALPWTQIQGAKYQGKGDFRELVPPLKDKLADRMAKDREFQWYLEDLAAYRKTRESKEVSLLESDRRAERDRDEQKRLERKAAREKAGDTQDHKDEPKPDSGLEPGEQPIVDERDDDAKGRPDLLLTETARVLSDAITLLEGNRALASRVKGFTLADNKRLN
jgi:carboxyl-terminal processing protease